MGMKALDSIVCAKKVGFSTHPLFLSSGEFWPLPARTCLKARLQEKAFRSQIQLQSSKSCVFLLLWVPKTWKKGEALTVRRGRPG